MNFISKHQIGLGLAVATVVVGLAVAACGGSDKPNGGNTESAQQSADSSSDRQNQEKGSVGQSLGTNPLAAGNPCDAFSMVGGAGLGARLSID